MAVIHKVVRAATKVVSESDGLVEIVASTEAIDRDDESVQSRAWLKRLDTFRAHPVLLSSHNYHTLRNQIGQFVTVDVRDGQLVGLVKYYINEGNEEADWGFKLAKRGMAAYSVGFIPHEYERGKAVGDPAIIYTDVELLEISHVTVPSNREALQALAAKNYGGVLIPEATELAAELLAEMAALDKGAMSPHSAEMADEEMSWDAAAEVGKAEGAAELRRMHAWMNSEGDPEAKSSYKLPHHTSEGVVVLKGCMAAGGVMMGSRGGVDIPEGDVAGVKAHLASHYHQFDRKAPWEEEGGEKGMASAELPVVEKTEEPPDIWAPVRQALESDAEIPKDVLVLLGTAYTEETTVTSTTDTTMANGTTVNGVVRLRFAATSSGGMPETAPSRDAQDPPKDLGTVKAGRRNSRADMELMQKIMSGMDDCMGMMKTLMGNMEDEEMPMDEGKTVAEVEEKDGEREETQGKVATDDILKSLDIAVLRRQIIEAAISQAVEA